MPEDIPPRSPLNRELILRTAVAIADEGGLEAVSMRALAGELGVTAMSLYNHVANKAEMIDGMIDLVIAEIELPEGTDWKSAIRTSSRSTREVLLRHRWAAGLWLSRQGGVGPARLRHGDWLLGQLRQSGLPMELVFHAYHILESYILGSALQQLSFPFQGEELAGIAQNFLQEFPLDDYPEFVEHVRQHLDPPEGSGFEFALDLILDSLDRAREPA
jgi:AcrR family transcriptional regulator